MTIEEADKAVDLLYQAWEENDRLGTQTTFEYHQYLDARRSLVSDRTNASMFLLKMHEFDDYIRLEQAEVRPWYKKLSEVHGASQAWAIEWLISNYKDRLDYYAKERKKFETLHAAALGRIESRLIETEQLRLIPIESVLGKPAQGERSKMKFYLCPLHIEKSPSFCWYTKNNSWYCFSCGSGGDIIALYQKMNKCTFVEACKELRNLT